MRLGYNRRRVGLRTTMLGIAVAVTLSLTGVVSAATRGPLTNTSVLALLNNERLANGLPGGVKENRQWSANCAAHNRYMAETGIFDHAENPASPYYTKGGAWAGEHSVLAKGVTWATGNPFDTAPVHLIQLMSPELKQIGLSNRPTGYVCMTTWPGYKPTAWKQPTAFVFPGPGTTDVPPSVKPDELPFAPVQFTNRPAGAATGFNIMAWAEGIADPWHARITSASVTGPNGPVKVKTLDRMSPTIGAYLPAGSGFIIPLYPLAENARYTVRLVFNRGEVKKTWSFTTGSEIPVSVSGTPAP